MADSRDSQKESAKTETMETGEQKDHPVGEKGKCEAMDTSKVSEDTEIKQGENLQMSDHNKQPNVESEEETTVPGSCKKKLKLGDASAAEDGVAEDGVAAGGQDPGEGETQAEVSRDAATCDGEASTSRDDPARSASPADEREELLESQVVGFLRAQGVKLWLQPYYVGGAPAQDKLTEVGRECGAALGASREAATRVAIRLQLRTLATLRHRQQYREKGVASLKVKCGSSRVALETSLAVPASALAHQVAAATGQDADRLKLICRGTVLAGSDSLHALGVTPGATVLALVLETTPEDVTLAERDMQKVNRVKEAAQYLADKDEEAYLNDQYTLQVADQTGKPIDLPPEEKRALVLAMSLHEKGRAALKARRFAEALALLLEADRSFSQCRSSLLSTVDNFAVLHLDIVWCYLQLNHVAELHDAADRLSKTEDVFRKSYGENLERLTKIKGGAGSERCLYVRLHLLQGIVAFHQGALDNAQAALNKAKAQLEMLTVDEGQMLQMLELGFSETESRLGLRAADGNISGAVDFVYRRREERKELREKEKEERKEKKLQRSLGTCANGQPVSVKNYQTMLSMGYSEAGAAEALRQTDNSITRAAHLLVEQPELQNLEDKGGVSEESLAILLSLGFDEDASREALRRFEGVVDTAVEMLTACGGLLPLLHTGHQGGASGRDEEKLALVRDFVEDLPEDEEEYIGMDLAEESGLLQDYLAKLTARLSNRSL